MARINLSTIMERPVQLLIAGNGSEIELRDFNTDELLAVISIDDLFDRDGNRFHNDLD